MFFEAHPEGRIGYKQLTDPDMGRTTGNIAHIGLFDDILTFLPNHYEGNAMLIYDDKADLIDVFFDRIKRKSGVYEAPKIRKGGRNAVSVVTVILDIVNRQPLNLKWYLIWFGLKSEDAVFFLFNDESENFANVSRYIDLTPIDVKSRIKADEKGFAPLLSYLENIVNQSSTEIQEQLEVASQTGDTSSDVTRRFRPFDIERANELFRLTGREGESLVAEYLDMLKFNKEITEYSWVNKDRESGLPYDFTIQSNQQLVIHADVKATSYKFEQPMIFSSQEIEFILQTSQYHIFRVYDLAEEQRHMRICENSKLYVPGIHSCINEFRDSIDAHKAIVYSVKIAVPPIIERLAFNKEITL